MKTTRIIISLIVICTAISTALLCPPHAKAWGEHGHRIAGQAAALKLPPAMLT